MIDDHCRATPAAERDYRARLLSITAWDGIPLTVWAWSRGGDAGTMPLLCLPGLVRTGGDFARLARHFAAERAVFALDYAGRGQSGRSRDASRYAAEACVQDVLDIASALDLERVVAIGTSFGGLIAMGLAAARPGLLGAVVLNDIGPEIGPTGAAAIRSFLAESPHLENLDAAVTHLRKRLPHIGITSDQGWEEFARLTYAPDGNGRWQPLWDVKIAELMARPVPDLWPYFGALQHLPVLLVHGAASEILLPATIARMQEMHHGLGLVEVPGVGHAPTLGEPAVVAALDDFLSALD